MDSSSNNTGFDGIKVFFADHLVKVLAGVACYFLMGIAEDIKVLKVLQQQMQIIQVAQDSRMKAVEDLGKENKARLDRMDENIRRFYQTYDLKKKHDGNDD